MLVIVSLKIKLKNGTQPGPLYLNDCCIMPCTEVLKPWPFLHGKLGSQMTDRQTRETG